MEKSKVALVIIFNHKFNKNIKVLREIYANRFSNIFFLVPFYEGTETDVIPVYENSYYFQGYLAQGFRQFYQDYFEQYFFVADDMVINPAMNENNYTSFFGINSTDNYTPQVFNLHNLENSHTFNFDKFKVRGKTIYHWYYTRSVLKFSLNKRGVECAKDLPGVSAAKVILEKQGFPIQPLQFSDVADNISWKASPIDIFKRMVRRTKRAKEWYKDIELAYPVVAGYSDIAIVNKATIHKFIQYCGIFAALDLWVEIALPTALLLASDKKVATEVATGKRGILYWNDNPEAIKKYKDDMDSYEYKLSNLLSGFPADKLYMHPVKLSKWTNDLSEE